MKRSRAADLEARGLAAERDLDAVEQARQARCRTRAVRRQSAGSAPTGSTVTIRTRAAALGKPAREVELGDVAAEQVLQVDRRDQQVDPRAGRRRRPPSAAARSCRDRSRRVGRRAVGPAAGSASAAAGRRAASGAAGRSRAVSASRRRHTSAWNSIHSAPSVSGRPISSRAPRSAEPDQRGERAVGAAGSAPASRRLARHMRAPQRIGRTSRTAAAGRRRRSSAGATSARARAARAGGAAGRAATVIWLAAAWPSDASPCWT